MQSVSAKQRVMTLPRFGGHFSYAKAYTGGIMTKRVKRRFTPEFRAEVVKLVIDGGKTSSQVARDHDLGTGLVAHWVKQAKIDAGGGPAFSLTSAEREELSRARKDLRELRRENDFLKKTAAWFASQSL